MFNNQQKNSFFYIDTILKNYVYFIAEQNQMYSQIYNDNLH